MIPSLHNLFEISHNQFSTRGFAYASGYTPLPDRKSFVPESQKESNRRFIEINDFKPGIRISSEGSKWPDFLMNGCGFVSFFVSERIINSFSDAKIDILDATEFPIESVEQRYRRYKLRIEDAPRYFVLEAYPELIPDWERMGVPMTADGKLVLDPLPKPWPPTPFIYRKDSWSGRDLVSQVGDTHRRLFCSDRVRLMAKAQKWTNLSIEGIGRHTIQAQEGS